LLSVPMDNMKPTKYSERGMGLIRRYALPDKPIYKNKLAPSDIQSRIDGYHQPYHNALEQKLAEFKQNFGASWHVDCHSMKSTGNKMNIDAGKNRPDIILGDNDGTTASSEFMDVVHNSFSELGYKVVRNDPYKGGYLITHYGNVANNQHSIQIEINRSLYMNEKEFTKNERYPEFEKDLSKVSQNIANYVRSQIKK